MGWVRFFVVFCMQYCWCGPTGGWRFLPTANRGFESVAFYCGFALATRDRELPTRDRPYLWFSCVSFGSSRILVVETASVAYVRLDGSSWHVRFRTCAQKKKTMIMHTSASTRSCFGDEGKRGGGEKRGKEGKRRKEGKRGK